MSVGWRQTAARYISRTISSVGRPAAAALRKRFLASRSFSWIDVPGVLNERGGVIHRRGVTKAPGLFFVGLTWQHTRGYALIGFVHDDAAFIADHIDSRSESGTRTTRMDPSGM